MSTVPVSRLGRLLGYDGVIATLLLTAFRYFLVSLSFVAWLLPALAFQALVGWQPTHLALVLGAGSLLTVTPALHGLVRAAEALLDGDPRAPRVFWRSAADAVRHRPVAALAPAAAVLVLGYDVALLGADAGVLLGAAAGAAGVAAVVIAVALIGDGPLRGLDAVVAAARLVLRRPHLALVWLLLAGLVALAASLSVVGALGWLFGPALAAVAATVCNRALGFAVARTAVGA